MSQVGFQRESWEEEVRIIWIYFASSKSGMTITSGLDTPRFYPLRNVPRLLMTPFKFSWDQMASGQKCFNELVLIISHRVHKDYV